MDFFAEQDKARARTRWLICYFILAMLGTSLGLYAVVMGAKNYLMSSSQAGSYGVVPNFWDPQTLLYVMGGTCGVILIGSLGKLASLSGGGAVVARDLGGRPIDPTTQDADERRVLNVVEEMSIASGIPAPQVWVMDGEEAINAFAAGTEPGNAVVGVTRGCITRLNRSELQGVVAHEFSHILNGDMKLNMRLMGWIFGVIMIGLLGRGLMRVMYYSGGRDRDGKNVGLALLVIGVAIVIIGSIGEFFARLIQAAISRQREFLADASAVQFTRDPEGLAGALKKIGGLSAGSELKSSMAGEASHMFFSGSGIFNWGLASHPPLPIRIKKLQADWNGEFIDESRPVRSRRDEESRASRQASKEERDNTFFSAVQAAAVLEGLGQSETQNAEKGTQVHSLLDQSWVDAAHDRTGARALIYGLLMAQEDGVQREEASYLRKVLGADMAEEASHLKDQLHGLHSSYKIALIDVALPTLRNLTAEEYTEFVDVTKWMIASDARVDLFEFMLQRMVARHLAGSFTRRKEAPVIYRDLGSLGQHALVILSTMAGLSGSGDSSHAAYKSAMSVYSAVTGQSPAQLPPSECSLDRIGEALDECEKTTAAVKKQLIFACGQAVMQDGKVTSREAELLRSVADAIGIPVPPFVDLSQVS